MLAWIRNLISGWIPIGLNSQGQPKPFGEWFGKIVWVIGIIFAFNFIMSLFSHPSNTNKPVVVALPFSHVGNVDQAATQKAEEPKRKWWMPIPYISVAGEFTSESKTGAKAEAGLRWDF